MPVGERIILREDRNRRSATISKLGAKRSREAADPGFHGKSKLARGVAQQSGGEMFLESRLRLFVNLMTDRDGFFFVLIDGAANLGVCIHGGRASRF